MRRRDSKEKKQKKIRRGRELLENFQKASFEEKTKKHGKLSEAKHLSFHPPFILVWLSLFLFTNGKSKKKWEEKKSKKKMAKFKNKKVFSLPFLLKINPKNTFLLIIEIFFDHSTFWSFHQALLFSISKKDPNIKRRKKWNWNSCFIFLWSFFFFK